MCVPAQSMHARAAANSPASHAASQARASGPSQAPAAVAGREQCLRLRALREGGTDDGNAVDALAWHSRLTGSELGRLRARGGQEGKANGQEPARMRSRTRPRRPEGRLRWWWWPSPDGRAAGRGGGCTARIGGVGDPVTAGQFRLQGTLSGGRCVSARDTRSSAADTRRGRAATIDDDGQWSVNDSRWPTADGR